MVKPFYNIFLIGPMGAGKSSIGRTLASLLKYDFYDSDQVVEERTGADLSWIFDLEGETGFRKREADVIDDLTQRNHIVLATGGGAILTPENRNVLASRGTVIYLKTSLEQQYERTRKDTKRPLLQTEDLKQTLLDLNATREPFYQELSDYEFDTDGLTVNAVANQIFDELTEG